MIVVSMRNWRGRVVLAIVLGGLAGCSGPKSPFGLSQVKGKVTYQGQPLSKGDIVFKSADGSKNATGEIINGDYVLSTFSKGDGVAPGQYQVAVTAWQKEPEMGVEGVPAIPAKYLNPDTSELTANVTGEANQVIDFALSNEGG